MSFLRSSIFSAVKCLDKIAARLPRVGGFRPLKGTFSAYEELKQDRLKGGILTEKQSLGPIPEGSITRISNLHQHHFQPWPVFWTVTDDARLVGNTRIWRNPQELYCIEGNYHLAERRRLCEDTITAQIFPGKSTTLPGAWTSIASNWGDGRNYYHWITDNLTRLWMLEHLPESVRVILPTSTASYIRESLELLGIAHECESLQDACLAPERYYFCSPLAMTGVWNPLGFDWLRKRFNPFFLPSHSGQPIFLTRRANTRVPHNLEEIEEIFSKRGFQIVDCGSLSVKEQIRTTSAAPAIAGLHGAAMTNLLWARPGTQVLEVFTTKYLNACYEQIAFQGGLPYQYHILSEGNISQALNRWCDQT